MQSVTAKAVRRGVHHDLGADELVVLLLGDEDAAMAEAGPLLHLASDEIDGPLHLLEDAPLEDLVLDAVHVLADLRLRAVVADEADEGARYLLMSYNCVGYSEAL